MGPGTSGMIAGYRLGEYVSQGAAAVVRLARDERLDRTVAVKILGPERAHDDAFTSGLLRTSRAAGALGHPHVLPVYEADEAGGTFYIAMRYVSGGDARSLLSRLGPLPVDWAWGVIAQAGRPWMPRTLAAWSTATSSRPICCSKPGVRPRPAGAALTMCTFLISA